MAKTDKKSLFIVVNVDWFFLSHRLPIGLAAKNRGFEVTVVSLNTGRANEIRQHGLNFIDAPFTRSGTNIFRELRLIYFLKKLYILHKPDIIHHVTLKPSIYGTIASKTIEHKTKIINAVSGLGYSFTDNRKSLGTFVLLSLLKWAFANKQSNFIFQNPDDKQFYQSLGFLTPDNYEIIKGSGVDEFDFSYKEPQQKQKLNVTLLARMLYDKGVMEFISAAESLRFKFINKVEFILVGGIDGENPASISEKELISKCDNNYIKWVGHKTNIKDIYEQTDIVCLPSYREGLPKSLVEAMAIGRPIVTTNTPGCRECVVDGENGFLVPVKDSKILADRLNELLIDNDLRIKMGKASRKKMEESMSLQKVINLTFNFYDRIN